MSVAKSLPHDAAVLHVAGTARYVDDIPMPADCLHLCFGLSASAHGTIDTLDLTRVRNAPGVVAVLVASDLPFSNDVSPSIHDEPLLADGTVHYVGQPVFLVAATSHLAARKAARLAELQITDKPALLTIDDAIKADSRFGPPVIWQNGDAEKGVSSAPLHLSGSLELGGQEHFYLEGQAAAALPQENGDLLVHSSTQHPTEIQHKVADAIGKPMHAVRVEIRRMGGGFGGKESQGNALAVACGIVATRTGRPAKMRYDRDDDMNITGKRHDFRIHYRVGYDDSGKILAVDFDHYTRAGWALDLTHPVADRAMLHSDNAYHIADMRITSHRLRTNTQSATAFRGFGGPQGMVGIERVLDHVAYELGMDPLVVRKRNYYKDLDKSGSQSTHYGQPVEDFALGAITEKLEKSSDYAKRRAAVAAWNATNPILKKGIALTPVKFGISFTLTHLNQAGALVHVYQDGSVHLNHGGTEMGQGLFQKVAQVAATCFGISMDAIKITATDTAKVPNTSATAASSGSDLNGMAVADACTTIRKRMAKFLAKDGDPKDVSFADDTVTVAGKSISFAEAAATCYAGRVSLSSTGFYATPKIEWDRVKGRGRPFFYFAYGAAVTEVILDTLTGENRILRTDIVHDTGASLNPALDIGQVEGAYVQGAGWLTTEELVWDDAGRLRTHAPSTYKIPASSDRPDIFNVELWNQKNPEEAIFRSKAVGEPPFMLGISVLMALSDAASACTTTYPSLDAPATAERLFMTLSGPKT